MGLINALSKLYNGLVANDGTGDDLRSGANTINGNSDLIAQAVNALAASQGSGVKPFATKAALIAAQASLPAGTVAVVFADATPANNTSYVWDGATLTTAYDRLTFALGNGSGFQNTGTGSVILDLQTRGRNVVNYGDHATLQQSLDECFLSGKPFVGRKGAVVTINSPLTMHPNLVADFSGMTIIAGSGITSGSAITVDGSISPTATSGVVRGLCLMRALVSGHADTSSVVDGLSLGGTSGQVSDMGWYDMKIFGFRDNLRFDGPNCYLNHFYNPQIGFGWRRAVAAYATTNSGENNTFHGGSIFDCNNTSFNGTGIYVDPATSGFEITLLGTSIDYCDISIDSSGGYIRGFGCHLENNNNNEHIRMTYVAGKPRPVLQLFGGGITNGPGVTSWTGIPVETTLGRPALVTVNTGDVDVFIEGTYCGNSRTNEYVTEIVKAQSGGNIRRADIHPAIDFSTNTTPTPINISKAINRLYVGTASDAGWTKNSASGGTLSFDNTVFKGTDVGSRKGVGTSGNSLAYTQTIPVRAKDLFILRGYVRIDAISSGYCAFRVDFLAQDGTTVIQTIIGNQINATTSGGFAYIFLAAVVPNGAVSAKCQDYFNNWTGTAWFSEERLWTL